MIKIFVSTVFLVFLLNAEAFDSNYNHFDDLVRRVRSPTNESTAENSNAIIRNQVSNKTNSSWKVLTFSLLKTDQQL